MDFNKMFRDPVNALRNLGSSLHGIKVDRFHPTVVPKKADKPGMKKEKKKTQKGAVHIQGRSFKPTLGALPPSAYRSLHLGRKKQNGQ